MPLVGMPGLRLDQRQQGPREEAGVPGMSEFKVGDRVRRVGQVSSLATKARVVVGGVYRVTGFVNGYPTLDVGPEGYSYDPGAFELVGVDHEAKYNELVEKLVKAYVDPYQDRLESYDRIVRPLIPKPKQYDVTVRVNEQTKTALQE